MRRGCKRCLQPRSISVCLSFWHGVMTGSECVALLHGDGFAEGDVVDEDQTGAAGGWVVAVAEAKVYGFDTGEIDAGEFAERDDPPERKNARRGAKRQEETGSGTNGEWQTD